MMNVLHSDPSTGRMPMPASVERLLNGSNKLLFASSDLDEVRSMVGRVMKPHRLDLTGQGERLDARMHYTSLGDLSVSRLRYGSAVQIEPGSLDSFFLVQMPLYGMARIESGAQHIDSSAELASVLSPQEATRMTWMAGTDQLMLRLSRSLVERTLVGYLGHPLNEPLRFELGFRWRECAPWQCMLSYLIDCTLQHHDLAMHKIVVSQIEQLAASILVTSHRHNHCEDAPARRSTILPRHVRRAQDFLEAHAQGAGHGRATGPGRRRERAQPLCRLQGCPRREPDAIPARPAHGTRPCRAHERRQQPRGRCGAALGLRPHGPLQQRIQATLRRIAQQDLAGALTPAD